MIRGGPDAWVGPETDTPPASREAVPESEERECGFLEVVTLIIAVVALVLAVIAFVRTGGIGDLRRQLDTVSSRTESARDRTADVLDRLEHLIRGKEKTPAEREGGSGGPTAPEGRP